LVIYRWLICHTNYRIKVLTKCTPSIDNKFYPALGSVHSWLLIMTVLITVI